MKPARPPFATWPLALALVAAALAPAGAPAQGHAHAHGVIRLDVALEPASLNLQFELPADSLLGFERAPRTEAEKKALAAVRQKLAEPATLFGLDAAAGCLAEGSPVLKSPLFEATPAAAGEHADVEAAYTWRCRQATVLKVLDLQGLLAAFPRIQRVEVQVAGPGGQLKQTLKRPQALVKLVR
jgi:hypothetical protein